MYCFFNHRNNSAVAWTTASNTQGEHLNRYSTLVIYASITINICTAIEEWESKINKSTSTAGLKWTSWTYQVELQFYQLLLCHSCFFNNFKRLSLILVFFFYQKMTFTIKLKLVLCAPCSEPGIANEKKRKFPVGHGGGGGGGGGDIPPTPPPLCKILIISRD